MKAKVVALLEAIKAETNRAKSIDIIYNTLDDACLEGDYLLALLYAEAIMADPGLSLAHKMSAATTLRPWVPHISPERFDNLCAQLRDLRADT